MYSSCLNKPEGVCAILAANKNPMRRFFEGLFNHGDLSVTDKIVGANYLSHNAVPGEMPGLEGLKTFVTYLRTGFPDFHFKVEDQIGEEDKVVTRFSVTGTQQAEFAGSRATGNSVYVTAINIRRLSDGQIHDAWLHGMRWA
jgi:predicted ester cyclase